jgi:hypothetical protein
MDDGWCGMVHEMAKRMGKEVFKHYFYLSMITVEHYKGVHGYLKDNFLIEEFLIKGTKAGVTAEIQEISDDDKLHLHTDPISRALNLVFNGDDFECVVCLLLALKGRKELGDGTKEGRKIALELSTVIQYMFDDVRSVKDIRAHAKYLCIVERN